MDILYEDDGIIVCYKPAGVATQTRAIGQKDMESELLVYLRNKGEKPQIHVVHRLDQPVEGVMVFAKTQPTAKALSKQVADHTFKKKYYAVITNESFPVEGELIDYLAKDAKTNLAVVSSKVDSRAKKATLKYKVVDEWSQRRLLEIELFTGRHHQIRAQLSSRQAPILGDVKYGGEPTGRNIALCSHYLGFYNPKSGKWQEFDIAPRGEDFLSSSLF